MYYTVECVQCVVHGLSVFMGVYVHISPVSVYIHVLHWVSVYFTYSYTRSLEQRNIRTPLGHMYVCTMYVHIQSFYSISFVMIMHHFLNRTVLIKPL